jgi:hypothetical protein
MATVTAETRQEFEIELRNLVKALQIESGRLYADAQRLAARGNTVFAAEILELSRRLDSLRRQAEQLTK